MPAPEDRAVAALRKWAVLLDSAFQVPGTRVRFGLDPVLGLIPGAGDVLAGCFSILIVLHAVRLRIPKVIIAKMMINVGIDVLAGAVPLIGDLFDVAWKANLRNLALLERHARSPARPSASDYAFVIACAVVILLLATIPILVTIWIFSMLSRYVGGV